MAAITYPHLDHLERRPVTVPRWALACVLGLTLFLCGLTLAVRLGAKAPGGTVSQTPSVTAPTPAR